MLPLTKLFVTSCVALLLASRSSAQLPHITLIQKNIEYYDMQTGATTGDWKHEFLVEGEEKPRKAGYFGQHLRKFIQSDSNAVRYLNRYTTQQTLKLITSVTTVVVLSIYGISNVAQKNTPENPNPPDVNTGLLYVGGATFVFNLVLRLIPPRSIFKAVNSYNESIGKGDTGFAGFDLETQNVGPSRQLAVGMKFNF